MDCGAGVHHQATAKGANPSGDAGCIANLYINIRDVDVELIGAYSFYAPGPVLRRLCAAGCDLKA
jgi:hypothetical protein